ncbi:hypothetical protein Tco_0692373 [Tanacetum coccineum]
MKDYINVSDMFVEKCQKCLELETELVKKDKVINDLSTRSLNLEKHCISLELDNQLNQEIFQRENSVSNESAPTFDQFFELNDLKAQLQEKDTTLKQLKEKLKDLRKNPDRVKKEYDAIETINIELEHKNVDLQEKVLAIDALENELKRIKGKHVVDSVTPKPKAITIAPGMFKVAVEPLPPKLFKNKEAHIDYIHKSRENANVLREIVEEVRASNPLDGELDLVCKYAERIQEELVYVHDTCPCLATPKERLIAFTQKNKDSKTKLVDPVISSQHREKLVDVTPKNKQKKVSFAEPLASSSNKKNDRIPQPPHSNLKNKVEAQHRKPTLSANKKNHVKTSVCDAKVRRTMLNANSELICVKCNQCMFDANHDACFLKYVSDMNVRSKPKSVKKDKTKEEWKPTGHVFTKIGFQWRPTGRKFSLVGNACPLTRITTTKEMPLKKTIPLAITEQTHVATRIYTRKPNVPIIVGSNRKSKVAKPLSSNKMEPGTSQGSSNSDVPSSSLDECRLSKLFYGIWTPAAPSI